MDISSLSYMTSIHKYMNQNENRQVSKASFASSLNRAASADIPTKSGQSFEDMWKSKFPGAKYHVMDVSKVSQGVWERNDFPFEKFFGDNVDETVLNWQSAGKEPAMSDSSVQSRLDSTLGGKSIVVPPALEEKMKNDPELAKRVMDKVDSFIANHPTRPGRVLSYLVALDENGDIAHFRVTGGGGHISGPSKEVLRQFEAEQAAKKEKKAKMNREDKERIQKNAEERKRIETDTIRKRSVGMVLQEQSRSLEFSPGSLTESALTAYETWMTMSSRIDV